MSDSPPGVAALLGVLAYAELTAFHGSPRTPPGTPPR